MAGMHLTVENFSVLRLARTPGVGVATVRRAVAKCGSARAAIEAWDDFTQGKRPLVEAREIEKELETLAAHGGVMVAWGSADYPPALQALPDAPLVLSVLGDTRVLHARQVAMVGNRSASAAALAWTQTCASELARSVVICSGLARGVDTAAHQGALTTGRTVAVVAGGVDHVYPPENGALRERIIGTGCVISEQPFGSAPTAQLFPRRNRIIAGLSIGVVVSEASKHSGSLITAQHALDYGREVWAVPGNPGDPRAGGPNHLLKQGAILVEGAADILDGLPEAPAPYLPPAKPAPQPTLFAPLAPVDTHEEAEGEDEALSPRQKIWALLGTVPVRFEDILPRVEMNEAELNVLMTELELDGLAARDALGGWRRA